MTVKSSKVAKEVKFVIVLSRQFVEFELLDFRPVLSAERNRIGRKQRENKMLGWRREISIRR